MNDYNDFAFGDLYRAAEDGECSEEDVLRDIETFLYGSFEGGEENGIQHI